MQNLNEHNITDEVVRRFKHVPSPRLQEIMTSLIKHLHEFAREVHLTEDEWFQGIQFVTSVGQNATTSVRNLSCCPIRSVYRNS